MGQLIDSLFEGLGRRAGKAARKGRWIIQAMSGDEDEAIQAEHLVGADLAEEVVRRMPLCQTPGLQEWLGELGAKLTLCVRNKQRRFRFLVVDSNDINAFALPGGYVFVTSPILDLCHCDDDETAFILGHEMGHIVLRHAADRLVANSVLSALSRTMPVRSALSAWLRKMGLKYLIGAYSRDNEIEADDFAVRITRAAGFDPKAGQTLLQRLDEAKQSESRLGELWGQYFGTHPPCEERVREMRSVR